MSYLPKIQNNNVVTGSAPFTSLNFNGAATGFGIVATPIYVGPNTPVSNDVINIKITKKAYPSTTIAGTVKPMILVLSGNKPDIKSGNNFVPALLRTTTPVINDVTDTYTNNSMLPSDKETTIFTPPTGTDDLLPGFDVNDLNAYNAALETGAKNSLLAPISQGFADDTDDGLNELNGADKRSVFVYAQDPKNILAQYDAQSITKITPVSNEDIYNNLTMDVTSAESTQEFCFKIPNRSDKYFLGFKVSGVGSDGFLLDYSISYYTEL
jgi:hypothetical protein